MSDKKEFDRREFLRKAAIAGAVAAWAAPVVQTVAATPAFAQTAGSAAPCDHSACVAACNTNATCRGIHTETGGNWCNFRCKQLCPPGTPCSAACTAAGLCLPATDAGSAWANTCNPADCNGGGEAVTRTTRTGFGNLHI
jgi:hypothetical protein